MGGEPSEAGGSHTTGNGNEIRIVVIPTLNNLSIYYD